MNKHKKKFIIIDMVLLVIFALIDQVSKFYIVNNLSLPTKESIVIFPNVLELRYQENYGGAWGILENQLFFFVAVTSIIAMIIVYLIIKMPNDKKYNMFHIALAMMMSGALSNLADRLMNGYVIDFIYFKAIQFPIFNLADVFVTIAAIILLFLFFFIYKEDDLNFLNMKQKKYREIKYK
ncbi:MAG: signal peptidase II [Lachnospiraceae bacterium]|nr:signal peptidase II [Lachnospiraceae bacterium]